MRTPFAHLVGQGKIVVGYNGVESTGCQQGLHIGEVYIAAVVITCIVSGLYEFCAQRWQLFGLVDILHNACRRLCREGVENCRQGAVGAEARSVEICEQNTL